MTIGTVTSPNIARTIRALRTADKELEKEWRREAYEKVAKPWAAELARQAPGGSKGAAAGRSIEARKGFGVRIAAGTRKGLWKPGFVPFFALNFGMHHNAWHKYIRKNRSGGGRHVVRRRSGTWAPVWQGPPHDYWFWRYWEANEDRVRAKVVTLTNDFMARL